MVVKGINYEDFLQYKKVSTFIICPFCDFKCDIEAGEQICQNSSLAKASTFDVETETLIKNYLDNPISKSIVFGGLEPLTDKTFIEILNFIDLLRNRYNCHDDIVIYTGYYKEEVMDKIEELKKYDNIIVKFGRFIPNQESHYDEILGIALASENQYAEKIS